MFNLPLPQELEKPEDLERSLTAQRIKAENPTRRKKEGLMFIKHKYT